MADNLMRKLPFTRFAMEMRSGKIIEIDEGFVKMLGIITELRETFIDQRYACYEHYFQTKTGKKIRVVVFIRIENKLLEGHRVLRVSVGNISDLK